MLLDLDRKVVHGDEVEHIGHVFRAGAECCESQSELSPPGEAVQRRFSNERRRLSALQRVVLALGYSWRAPSSAWTTFGALGSSSRDLGVRGLRA